MAMRVKLVDSTTSVVKSFSSNTLNTPKVHNVDLVKSMPISEVKAYYENPLRMSEAMNYKQKPTNLSYGILYQMSVKNSVVAAVLNTRINQVSMFTQPARFSEDGVGYEIRLRDPNAVPNEEQQDIMRSLELFLENCGYKYDADRDNFDTFIRKIVRDSLTYDQATFEIIPDRRGLPAEFVAVDAATIRAASESFDENQISGISNRLFKKTGKDIKYVQVIDGTVISAFTGDELAFGIRNARTNINLQPYGFSELEQLINQITSHLYAEEYNSKFFSQGGTTKGIINIKSDPNGIGNKEQLESFKRQWRAQVNGMTGAWKTPVLQVPDGIEYLNVSQSNRDMEFSQWMNYLINIVCAVYQIDPAEVNFANNGGAAGQSSVFESSQEQKLKNSKDKGLKPLLRFVEAFINKNLIYKFSQEYVFVFKGLDEKSDDEKADLDSKQSKTWKTVNEIRKDHGFKPLDNGDVILDSSWMNYVNQQSMMGSSPGGMEDEGVTEEDSNVDSEDEGYSGYTDDNSSVEDESESGEMEDSTSDSVQNDSESSVADEDYSGYLNSDDVNKSLSKLIITIED